MIKKLGLLLMIWSIVLPVLANDAIGYSSIGGIILGKTDDIAMKKEILNLSYDKISVDYEFINESDNVLEETIIFPLPAYTAEYQMSAEYYGEPYNFLIQVNGKKVNFTTQIRAFIKEKDVTQSLRNVGLSDRQIAYFPMNSPFKVNVKDLTKIQIKDLLKLGLLRDPSINDDYTPVWSVQASYIWKQIFLPHKALNVHHEYVPFVAAGPGVSYIDKKVIHDFCMNESFLNGINKVSTNDYTPVYQVSYILQSANTWKNGIEDFTLNINKRKPEELVSLCFPGDFNKINSTTIQLHLYNFKPKQDLLVYFANYKNEVNNYNLSHPIQLK